MAKAFESGLNSRLTTHFSARSTPFIETLKRSAGNWPYYAAAAGSAMAMATNAAASGICSGSIVCSNTPVMARVNSVGSQNTRTIQRANVPLGNGNGFQLDVAQFSVAPLLGSAFLFSNPGVLFLDDGGFVRKLSSGGKISSGAGKFNSSVELAGGHAALFSHPNTVKGWSGTGFAGFRFQASAGQPFDYGWIKLSLTRGDNGLPNSVTSLEWAYDSTGASINAGQLDSNIGPAAAPEPSTMAMALLAAGAAGVVALRRRRKSAATAV